MPSTVCPETNSEDTFYFNQSFIDFEIELGENDRARELYEGLLERTQHVKVWASFAAFEAGPAGDAERSRAVFERAYKHFKDLGHDHKEQVRGFYVVWLFGFCVWRRAAPSFRTCVCLFRLTAKVQID